MSYTATPLQVQRAQQLCMLSKGRVLVVPVQSLETLSALLGFSWISIYIEVWTQTQTSG
jgi:hypothetical protein